jgi:hypothetical protein
MAADEISERGLWRHSVQRALLWRCIPRLRARLAQMDVDAGEATAALASIAAEAAAHSALVCHGAARAMEALDAAGVRAAAFKGVGMIASVYRNPGSRMICDADILLERNDFHLASAALGQAGFRPAISMGIDEWLALLEVRVYPAHDFLDFVNDDGVRLDVHWSFGAGGKGFSIGDMLDRSVTATLARREIRVVAAEDSILLSASHLLRDRLSPRTAVKDLADIDAWLSAEDRWSPDILLERASAAGFVTSILTCLRILAHHDRDGRAAEIAGRISEGSSPGERESAGRLASLFAHQLRRGEISDAAVGMAAVTPSLAARFLVSRIHSLTDSRYRRNKFSGGDQPRASASTRRFLRDLYTFTPERFRQYRALGQELRRQLK